ncbi:hypothetical protein ACIOWE_18390 [Pseudomonas sp. NPDC087598]|uniref:hypothetical protein n=1 Tax=Pseudomonas sp. NPDC087598 TaxID=3364440 RepID=UPI0037F3D5BC
MDFPAIGDAEAYRIFGETCAAYIENSDTSPYNCYNGIRPVGIMIYHALPFLFTSDPIKSSYISLMLNIICLIGLIASVLMIFRNLNDSPVTSRSRLEQTVEIGLVFLTILFCISYIPVRSSDIQSLVFFVSSIAIVSNKEYRHRPAILILAGALAGTSVLLKQNYVASIFFLVVFWLAADFREHINNKFKTLFWYLLGTSVCLIQVALVFHNSTEGTLWFYEPKYMETYTSGNVQPYVELIAFTKPEPGAYITTLQQKFSTLEFVAIRFYEGVSKFYWSMYLATAPFDEHPAALIISNTKIFFIQLGIVLSIAASLATYLFKNKWMLIISLMALASGLLTASIMHTENRYYVMTKLLYLLVALAAFTQLYKKTRAPKT